MVAGTGASGGRCSGEGGALQPVELGVGAVPRAVKRLDEHQRDGWVLLEDEACILFSVSRPLLLRGAP